MAIISLNQFSKIKFYIKQIFLIYILGIFGFLFHLKIFLTFLTINIFGAIGTVNELDELDYIPKNSFVSKTFVNCNLPKPKFDLIKFFYESNETYFNFSGFLPTIEGNPFYTGGYYDGLEKDLNYQVWNHNATYVHLKNIYTTFSSALLTINFEYIKTDPYEEWVRGHPNGALLNIYDHVIALGNKQLYFFGHWFHDVLGPLTLFPNDIIQKSYIIVSRYTAAPIETIFAFGVDKKQLLILKRKQWIFAKNCYTTLPQPHLKHFGKMMRTVSFHLRKYYNVDQIEPTKYFISNRKPGEHRYIGNMNEVVFELQNAYKGMYEIEYLQDPNHISEIAKTWASAKLILVVTGSTCIKSIFMKEKTVILIALGELMDNCQPLIAATHDVFSLTFYVENMIHYSREPSTIKIPLAIRVFGIGAYCANHGRWPSNESFYY